MKNLTILVCALVALLLTCNTAQAQSDEARYQRMKDSMDKVNYDKGDLYQLVQNTYLAFKAYCLGRGITFNDEERYMPAIHIYNKNETQIYINRKDLKYIPLDVVQTIEVTYDPDMNPYGMSSMICMVRIVLKDNWEEAYKAAKAAEEKPVVD